VGRTAGALDEIVSPRARVHLEQLAPGHWWLCLEAKGRRVLVDLHSARPITATVNEEPR
jgi:hypothetical protein